MTQLFSVIFDKLNVSYTSNYLKNLIAKTPYINSLFGVATILNHYGIQTNCVRFENKRQFSASYCPSIIIYEGVFSIVESISDSCITLFRNNAVHQIPSQDFFYSWSGVALLLDSYNNSAEPNYRQHRLDTIKSEITTYGIFLCCLILGGLSIIKFPYHNWIAIVLLLFVNVTGIAVSFMLLQKQLHISNKVADKICGLVKESHCDKVTESDGATLFGLVKLSEVGFGFFLTNTIILMVFHPNLFWMAVYAACVLPFSFWSIWYQKYKAKSWCVLCLITLTLMWLQAGAYLLGGAYRISNTNLITPIMIGASYVLSVLLTHRTMELLDTARQDREWRRRYEELKSNDKVISAFIENKYKDTTSESCSSLLFGNPNADNTLTVFSNPYCGPCAMMHDRIKELPGDCVNVRYVMTFFSEDKSTVNKAIIAAYQQLGAAKTWQILTEWFARGKKNGIDFFKQYDIDLNSPEIEAEFHKQCEWPKDKPIYGTPTDMINGREIVWPYSVEDLFYLT